MASSTIDALVVTLGLDSKAFSQGIKGSTEELAGFTRRLAGMFFAIRGLEDVVGYFKDLHKQLAEVGFQARNLGVTGTEIRKLGEVSQLFGGQVSDAADSIEALQASIFNLRYRGQVSDSIAMLQRFGVAYLNAAGHMRNFRDIAMDAAGAIDRQAKAAGLTQGERYQMALSFGFTGGIASAVAQGGKGLEEAMREARVDQKALTEKTIQGQVQLDRDITRLQNVTAAQSSVILSKLTPAIEHVIRWLEKLATDLLPKLVHAIDALMQFFNNPPAWLQAVEDTFKSIADVLGPNGALLAAIGGLALAFTNLPLAVAGAIGLVLGHIIDLIPGVKKISEKLGDEIYNWLHPDDGKQVARTIENPHLRHGEIVRTPAPPTPTAPRPPSAAQQSGGAGGSPTAMIGGGGTQVHIDEININTRATDANGIASSIGGAMQRKLLVSNADGGLG